MIILEGPDGSGKSTLGNMLLEDGIITKLILSPGRTRKNVPLLDQTMRYMKLYSRDPRTAIDRYLFSEMVYGPILREKSKFSKTQYMTLFQELMLKKTTIIFCLPGVDNLKFKEDESPLVVSKINEVYNSYSAFYTSVRSMYKRIHLYNWKEPDSYDNLVSTIEKECPSER